MGICINFTCPTAIPIPEGTRNAFLYNMNQVIYSHSLIQRFNIHSTLITVLSLLRAFSLTVPWVFERIFACFMPLHHSALLKYHPLGSFSLLWCLKYQSLVLMYFSLKCLSLFINFTHLLQTHCKLFEGWMFLFIFLSQDPYRW